MRDNMIDDIPAFMGPPERKPICPNCGMSSVVMTAQCRCMDGHKIYFCKNCSHKFQIPKK